MSPSSPSGRVSGAVAIVTGATSGIGRATAVLLAREGASVVAAGRRAALGAELVAQLGDEGLAGHFVETDVSRRADVERLVREATARLAELEAAPGVQMGAVPPDALIPEWGGAAPGGKGWGQADDDAAAAADERLGAYGMRHLVVRDPEGGDDGATFY